MQLEHKFRTVCNCITNETSFLIPNEIFLGQWLRSQLNGYIWSGLYYDRSRDVGTWRFLRNNDTFQLNDRMKRDPESLDEQAVSFQPCMQVKLDKAKDFFWYKAANCADSAISVGAVCYERECFTSFKDILMNHVAHQKIVKYTGLDLVKDNFLIPFTQHAHRQMKSAFKALFKKLLMPASKSSILEFMWNTNLPCFDDKLRRTKLHVLAKCSWKGVEVPCQEIFSTVSTDSGMCCAFNAQEAEDAYKESQYMDTVKFLRAADGQDKADNRSSSIDLTTQSGKDMGLTVYLDARSDVIVEGTVATESRGFIAYVSPRSEYPWVRRKGFAIEPGKETLVQLQATRVRANKDDIGHISAEDRNCLFPDETPLQIHRNYSMASCIYECSVDIILHALQSKSNLSSCIPWYFVQTHDDTPFCDPWQARVFEDILGKVLMQEDCPHCLADCETTTYTATQSASSFRWEKIASGNFVGHLGNELSFLILG